VFAIEDYEAKYYTLLRLAAGQNISCIATVNPSTIVLLADRLAHHSEAIIRDVRDGSLSADVAVPPELRASLHLKPDPERARRLEQAANSGGGVLLPGWRGRSWRRSAAGKAGRSAPTSRGSTPCSRSGLRSGTSATTPPSCVDRFP
jgi:hypothetical protein